MPDYKNQHYLPQFYLNGFTNPDVPGQLYVFKRGHSHWTKSGVSKVALQYYLHSYRDETGEMNHEIEKVLGELEGKFSPILNKVLKKQALSNDEQLVFAYFLAVSWHRVPAEVEHWNQQWTQVFQMMQKVAYSHYIQDPSALEKFNERYQQETGRNDMDALRAEDLDPSKVSLKANSLMTLVNMLESARFTAAMIFRMGWIFLESNTPNFFISSDHPFCMLDPTKKGSHGTGLGHPNVEICMPLSRHMAFFAGGKTKGRHWLPASTEFVHQINFRTVAFAEREIIAPKQNFPGYEKIFSVFT